MVLPNATDTIAAIATPAGRGGVGVVRVSGAVLQPLTFAILGKLPAPRVATLCRFRAGDGTVIDEGIALYYPAPRSYTGETVLELQGHGGTVVSQLLLQRCLELGARLARPGEFSQRAFLNGKLDLAQAESVADLIDASTAAAARSAARSLTGDFSKEVHALVDALISLRVQIEGNLDFPEEEIDALAPAATAAALKQLLESLREIQRRAQQGSLLRSGMHVVLAGQPNVGKSSLLNRLAGQDRAIVTDTAGTTRDALRETIQIEGVPLHVVDTAGLRMDAQDHVERIGIERSWQELQRADLILLLVDARVGVSAADEAILAQLPAGTPRLTLYNKCDLAGLAAGRHESGGTVGLHLSALTGEGVAELQQELLRAVGWRGTSEDAFFSRERHLEAIRDAFGHLNAASDCGANSELIAEELRLAQNALNRITGEYTSDDLLGKIFSRFCIGK